MPEGRANPECGAGSTESLDEAVLPGFRVLILVNEQEAIAVTKDLADFPKVKKSGSVVQGVILRAIPQPPSLDQFSTSTTSGTR